MFSHYWQSDGMVVGLHQNVWLRSHFTLANIELKFYKYRFLTTTLHCRQNLCQHIIPQENVQQAATVEVTSQPQGEDRTEEEQQAIWRIEAEKLHIKSM